MLKFEGVSSDPQIVRFVKSFVGYLSNKENPSYLFGSAIWRLKLNEFGKDNDLDFLLDNKDIAVDKEVINHLCNIFSLKLTKYELIEKIKSTYCTSQHIVVVINDDFKIDLVYVNSMNEFIENMSDVDIGMMLYNLHTNEYVVGGNYINIHEKFLTIDQIFDCAHSKTITMRYIQTWQNQQTKMSRLIKLLNKGFTIDSATHNVQLAKSVTDIFMTSFYLPIDNYGCTPMKCGKVKKYLHLCTCTPRDSNFVEFCLNDDAYQLIKKFYLMLVPSNHLNDKMLAYALYMKDFEFAKYVLTKYYKTKVSKFNLMYIPILLRRSGDFDLTVHFLDFFITHKYVHYYIAPSCYLQTTKLYEAFLLDAFIAEDDEYILKLGLYNDIFRINELSQTSILNSTMITPWEKRLALAQKHANLLSDAQCASLVVNGANVIGSVFLKYVATNGLRLYKFVNKMHKHYEHTYTHGHNVDSLPFCPLGSCTPGGLYFTDHMNIMYYARFGVKLCSVTVYPHSRVYIEGDKYKTDQFFIDIDNHIYLEQFICDKANSAAVKELFSDAMYHIKDLISLIEPSRMNDELCSILLLNLSYDDTYRLVTKMWTALAAIVGLWTEQQIVDTYKTDYKKFSNIPDFMYSETVGTLFLEQVCVETPEYAEDCRKIVNQVHAKIASKNAS